VATDQSKFVFYDSSANEQKLELLAQQLRRTKTSLLREALELLFAAKT